MLSTIVTLAIFCATITESYKILLLFPIATTSHYNPGSALAKGLADAGHNVTIVSPFEEKYVPKKGSYREIVLTGFIENQYERKADLDLFTVDGLPVGEKFKRLYAFARDTNEKFFSHVNFQKLLHSNETFDATIMEQPILESIKGLPSHFNSHQILLSPVASSSWVDHLVGNPSLPSCTPDILMIFPPKMNFWQRLGNFVVSTLFKLYLHFYTIPTENEVLKEYLPNAEDLEVLINNVSLILINGHPSINYAQNRVPNMIDVAGVHIKGPQKLSTSLQEYLDDSKKGLVYFSMGSIAESKNMPIEKRNMILRALGSLKLNVLWKWEEDNLPGKPENVRIEKWLPQESILAHPNVKLFITQCGFQSFIETIHYGVPIVGIPIFFDQILNAKYAESSGMGKAIHFHDLEEDELTKLIHEVLTNPQYTDTVRQKSIQMKDRPVPPLETAIYWVEYVIRHNGAKHLRVAALDLSWYQYYLLDVIGFLVFSVLLGIYIIKNILKWCCRGAKVCAKKEKIL